MLGLHAQGFFLILLPDLARGHPGVLDETIKSNYLYIEIRKRKRRKKNMKLRISLRRPRTMVMMVLQTGQRISRGALVPLQCHHFSNISFRFTSALPLGNGFGWFASSRQPIMYMMRKVAGIDPSALP